MSIGPCKINAKSDGVSHRFLHLFMIWCLFKASADTVAKRMSIPVTTRYNTADSH